MRKLIAATQMTLDGVMQAPGGPEEDPTGGFELGGWSFGYFDDVLGQQIGEAMAKPSTSCSAARRTRSSPPTGPSTRVRSPTA